MPETAQYRGHRGTPAIERMVEFAPSTGGLALWVRHQDLPQEPAAGPSSALVSTDGYTLFYAPGFERMALAEQTALVAHEVLHVALRHPQRYLDLQRLIGDVDLQLFNVCADAIVNSTLGHLSWLRLPASAVLLDRLLLQVPGGVQREQGVESLLLEWDVERLYRAIDDRRAPERRGHQPSRQSQSGGKQSNPSQAREDGPKAARVRALGGQGDDDLRPAPSTRGPPEREAEQAREWSERILRAHAGDGAHSMLRTLVADLPKTRTPWEQVLRTQLTRSLAPKRDISWSRPARSYIANQGRGGANRRLPWEPGFGSSKSVPRLALIVDVSGSIDDQLMERFAREIEAIARRLEAGMVLIIGDDRVQRVVQFAPGTVDLGEIEFNGRGGTDFTPLIEEAERHRPDIAVVLTDLDGPARFRPRWPVIWAVPESHAHAVAPFGRKLTLS